MSVWKKANRDSYFTLHRNKSIQLQLSLETNLKLKTIKLLEVKYFFNLL